MLTNKNQVVLKALGEKLHQQRKAKKLSLRQLASIADVDYSQIDKIEKGRLNITIITLISIADALEMSPGELLDYNPEERP
ncbi:helix-turn-helix domain-containing protein [Chitinophaga defluvii]|uniref:Helix-turn-helix transcriptional regulator n=1 Tax=Chitinophaga defluvii TaxID=3163343 RepID=A0ABV2T8W7_9BACT